MSADKKAIKIFIAYSQKDRMALDDLRTHAAPLLRQGNIQIWYDGEIIAGEVWDEVIKANLERADIILLLLSSHSLASEYFYNKEVKDALKRHEAGKARVVPIILSACLWQKTPLATLQGLPTGMIPISKWPNRDDAWNDVLMGLSDLVDELEREEVEPKTVSKEKKYEKEPPGKQTLNLQKPLPGEEHAWEFTVDNGTVSVYEKFLARFPNGIYATAARERLEDFKADAIAWEFAQEDGRESAIQKYLDKYPDGLYALSAKVKILVFEKDRINAAGQKKQEELAERRRIDPFYDLMIPIKGGTFEMGDTFGDGDKNEKPVHSVTLSDFLLCKYPVTQGLWKAVMGEDDNLSQVKGDDELPVERVAWYDGQKFIAALNKKSGQQYRLPTEAEWEYAARGGNQSKGYKYSGSDNLTEVAWYKENSNNQKHPVGSLKANELGLFDMSGNVWELCQDWYDKNYYETCKKNGVASNPPGPGKGLNRVIRGGCYYNDLWSCRTDYRGINGPTIRLVGVGFRLVLPFPLAG